MAQTERVFPQKGRRFEQLSISVLYVRYKDMLLDFLV